MGRKEDVEVAAAFDFFKTDDEEKCIRARCKHCGHEKAKNTLRQRLHLTECPDYPSAVQNTAAGNDSTQHANPEPENIPREEEEEGSNVPMQQANTETRKQTQTGEHNEFPGSGFRRRRGRPLKGDKVAMYECHSLQDLQNHLKQLLDVNASFIPTLLEANFVLQSDTRFHVPRKVEGTVPEQSQNGGLPLNQQNGDAATERTADMEIDTWQVLDTQDDAGKLELQRDVSKIIIDKIKEVDGFGYGRGNHWTSTNDGHRFQFLCYDSLQNSNRGRRPQIGGAPNAAGHSGDESSHTAVLERTSLPSFDCRGAISVKFCRKSSRIEAVYSHARIHRTLASRKGFRAGPRKRIPKTPSSIQHGTEQSPLSTKTDPGLPHDGAGEAPTASSQLELDGTGSPMGLNNHGSPPYDYDQSSEDHNHHSAQQYLLKNSVRSPGVAQTNNGMQSSPSLIHTSNQNGASEHHSNTPASARVNRPVNPASEGTEGQARKNPSGLKRKRTRTGCHTCRKRRTKCDETHPICLNCQKGFRECSYTDPAAPIFAGRWINPEETAATNAESSLVPVEQPDQSPQPTQASVGWQYMPTDAATQRAMIVKNPQALSPTEDQLSEASVAERLLRLLTQNNGP